MKVVNISNELQNLSFSNLKLSIKLLKIIALKRGYTFIMPSQK
jgi:uncharacterized protein with PhoU and TrkA domain